MFIQGNYRYRTIIDRKEHYAYLKIGEGCNRTCAFCSIPYIRGPHVSRPVGDILEEARFLASRGVKELLVISQDITYYGQDLYHRQMLPELVACLCEIDEIEWVRLHYTYPVRFPLEVIRMMRDERKICRYIDIPVQHASDRVLKMMRRNITAAETSQLIAAIRDEAPDIALRTTLIVGHPGETDDDFARLANFVRQTRFDRLGVFTYSHEEHTYAAKHYKDTIPDAVKQERADHIMEIQKRISEELNREKVGKTFKTLIDRTEGTFYVGRTEYDSPEVDMEVLIPVDAGSAEIGRFYPVRITGAEEFDLYGEFTGQEKP